MKLVKKKRSDIEESVITIEYSKWSNHLENISNFIQGRMDTIPGYAENKTLCSVKVDSILYFEAVGELVFAYTKDNVYEIKMRLYQAEELVERNSILRASKSILVNVRKIDKLRSALNGRMVATLLNGEEILISRAYSKNIANYIKSA